MHGGVKFYRGSAAAARSYVEADRSRADDYYLAEGSGVAQRYVASGSPGVGGLDLPMVREGGTLDGDAYEAWVAGYDTKGRAKGRLRTDEHGLRFVEVVVNGPKTWSLAASVHPEIAAAYDAAQTGCRGRDHRVARRARHHPGGPARAAGPGPGGEARGRGGAALHLPGG